MALMKRRLLAFLIILYFVYMIIGAAVFMVMERPYEIKRCEEAKRLKKAWIRWTKENNEVFDEDTMDEFIVNVTKFVGYGISLQGEVKCPINWNFESSLFFTGTIITTIGYGNLAPVLWYSQIFCIFYALIGIPLFAIMFSGLGQYISEFVQQFLNKFDDLGTISSASETKFVKSFFAFVIICGGSLVFFQLIPAIVFTFVEEWSYRESFYYCFITLTTIGFGDYVAGSNPEKNYIALYRILVLFWIVFGLAYTFTAINLIVEIFRRTFLRSPFAKFFLSNWREAEDEVFSELESLLGAGSSDGGDDGPEEPNPLHTVLESGPSQPPGDASIRPENGTSSTNNVNQPPGDIGNPSSGSTTSTIQPMDANAMTIQPADGNGVTTDRNQPPSSRLVHNPNDRASDSPLVTTASHPVNNSSQPADINPIANNRLASYQ